MDETKYIKKDIENREKNINNLSYIKNKYINELKNICIKLENILINFRQTPEQKNKIRLLYLILNINKKNNNESLLKNKSLQKEYKVLLNRNNYDPIERINEFRTKIDISQKENSEILNQISILKYNNIKRRNKLKLFAYEKNNFDINNLTNELNTLNNEKQRALNRIKNNKKIINVCKIKYENMLECFSRYKKENMNMNFNNIKNLEKDINILKNDLNGDEQYILNKILNNKMQIMKEISYPCKVMKRKFDFSENISKNNSFKFKNEGKYKIKEREKKSLRRSESAEYLNRNNNFSTLRTKYMNLNELPKISMNSKNKNNNFRINNNVLVINSSDYILNNDKEKSLLDELNLSQINEKDYNDINNKKEHYYNIIKKLDYSIKEVENMYKRKIMMIEVELNDEIKKITDIENRNNLIKKEIENLNKIYKSQIKFYSFKLDLNKENSINEIKENYEEKNPFNTNKKNKYF